ncbi:MAG: transposase, partial [Myxococcales bacterium]|nr:transposase [Myxococcales bacterium]
AASSVWSGSAASGEGSAPEDDGGLSFHPLPEPTLAEVHAVAERIARRIERVLHKAGRFLDHDSQGGDSADHDEFADEEPVLASCYRAATTGRQLLGQDPGQPVLRLVGPPPTTATRPKAKLVAEVRGVNVHAERLVDGRDRPQLERLCRYLARPPLAHDRLTELKDGRLRLTLKTPWPARSRSSTTDHYGVFHL